MSYPNYAGISEQPTDRLTDDYQKVGMAQKRIKT